MRACRAQFTLAARKDPLSRVDCDGLAAGVGWFVGQSSAMQRTNARKTAKDGTLVAQGQQHTRLRPEILIASVSQEAIIDDVVFSW